jgi:hypothetical protein
MIVGNTEILASILRIISRPKGIDAAIAIEVAERGRKDLSGTRKRHGKQA